MVSVSPLEALLIGVLQGFLEWLPLSSEGLTSLTLMALGLGGLEAVNLSIMLHLGTSIAAIIYFHRDLSRDFRGDKRILRVLLIATPSTGLTALPLYGVLRGVSSLGVLLQLLIGFSLISTGLLMRGVKHGGGRETLTPWETAALGVVQGLAVIPGVSRSGITLTYLLFRGLEPSQAFSLAYMLGIPLGLIAPIGLTILGVDPSFNSQLLLALISSFAVALISIDLLLKAARSRRIWILCLSLGVATILVAVLHGWWI